MTDKRIRIILDSRQAEQNAKQLDKDVRGIGAAADASTFAINKLAAAISSAIAVDRIVRYSDAWTQVENQVRRTTESQEELIATTAELLQVSNDTRFGIEDTTALYTSLTISTASLGTTQEEVIGVTKTINNLFLESGKSAEEASGAIRQLGQALESGTLRGDEFNSVAEGAPGILRAIESQTGKTRAELRELAAEGKITAEILFNALKEYEDAAQSAADKTERTLAQSFIVAENNATAFVGASRLVGEAVGSAGDAMIILSENLDVLVNIAGAAAALYVARLIPAITASTAGFIAQSAAALKATQTVNAMGVVTAKTTVTMNAMTLSARAASASLAFLGGPAGVVFLAVAALATFALGADDAAAETDTLTESTDVLTQSYKDLTAAQAAAQRIDVVKEIQEQESAISDLQAKLDRMRITTEDGFSLTLGGFDEEVFTKTEAAIDTANSKVEALRGRLDALNTTIQGGDTVGGGDVFDEGPSDRERDALATFTQNQQAQTASLQRELDLRKNISAIYRTGELDAMASQFEQERAAQKVEEQTRLAELQAKAEDDAARRALQFEQRLASLTLEDEQEKALRAEFDNQQLISDELLQQQRTAIEAEGAKDRQRIAQLEAQTRLDTWSGLAASGLKILQAFGNDSFQSQKNFAIAEGIVNIAGGVAKALNNPYPANLAFAAQVGLQGAALINTIRSAKPGSGGAAPNVSGGAASAPAPTSATASNVEPEQQNTAVTVFNLRSDDIFTGAFLAEKLNEHAENGGTLRANLVDD